MNTEKLETALDALIDAAFECGSAPMDTPEEVRRYRDELEPAVEMARQDVLRAADNCSDAKHEAMRKDGWKHCWHCKRLLIADTRCPTCQQRNSRASGRWRCNVEGCANAAGAETGAA
jgi:hypothetical protein